MEFKRIAIDASKHVFTIYGIDDQEHPVLRRDLRRSQVKPPSHLAHPHLTPLGLPRMEVEPGKAGHLASAASTPILRSAPRQQAQLLLSGSITSIRRGSQSGNWPMFHRVGLHLPRGAGGKGITLAAGVSTAPP
jgi:hypothetical protein